MGTRTNPAGSTAQPAPDIQTQKPFVAFKPDNVPPAQSTYLQLNDFLFIRTLGNLNGITLFFNYRYLTPQGEIKEGQLPLTINANPATLSLPLGEAWLLSFGITPNAFGGAGTWAFLQVGIARNIQNGVPVNFQSVIWQGYVSPSTANGWPNAIAKEIWDGAGALRSITGSTPAAGADISEIVPSNRRWNLLAFHATLTTSAAVANRQPLFFLDDGASTFYFGEPLFSIVAALVVHVTATPNIPSQAPLQSFTIFGTLPLPILLKAGYRIHTNTSSIQAGDQWSAPQYIVQEWGSWEG